MTKITNNLEVLDDDHEPKTRYAILVNDMLNDFIHGKLKCKRATQIIPNIRLLLEKARENKIPIFYCNDEHLDTDRYEIKLWGAHAMKHSDGAKVINELKPRSADYIVSKRRYSSFDRTRLHRLLEKTYGGRGANTLVMTGVHTHICVKHTAYDAFVRGYNVIVAEDAVEAFTEDDNIAGLNYMKQNYGAEVQKITEILKVISR
ncbi:MAG TPA: isochorismatase family cysteine hydrolase [Candidatus Nitrosopolaris sp.]|nr:isochorismatase family cysteine hydrolase [Candidatus Nitrosopolaris sp.]